MRIDFSLLDIEIEDHIYISFFSLGDFEWKGSFLGFYYQRGFDCYLDLLFFNIDLGWLA